VGECLYRYSSSGVYYARVKKAGKQIRRSLRTDDRATAGRKLRELRDAQQKIDPARGKLTLAELCERFLRTVQHQKRKTIERKALIVSRLKRDWPGGSSACQVRSIRQSDVQLWLAQFSFGPVSRNLHLACAKEVFALAVADRVISESPAAAIKSVKLAKPIRKTPTFEEFRSIVADIRAQPFSAEAGESADFVEFIGLAGLGQAEASTIEWPDVHWDRQQITTFRHKTKSGFAIPLYPQLRPLLERRYAQRGSDSQNVFRIKDAKRAIAGACRRLDLPPYSHRSFRRMFITRAIELGVDVKVIAEWQGHKDGGKLILSTYSHVRRAHSQRMAQLMAEPSEETNLITFPPLNGEAIQ
jgi:integrase